MYGRCGPGVTSTSPGGDNVPALIGGWALMMSCRAILVVRVCVGVRLTHEKPPAEPAPHAADALDTDIS